MHIIIPSYEPDQRLVTLVDQLQKELVAQIVIVNDGSAPAYDQYFQAAEALGATVLTHPENRGKGAALKTAFTHLRDIAEQGACFITVDSDGQHLVSDILKVAAALDANSGSLVLGTRAFVGQVPLRSRFGNRVTASLFHLVTGQQIGDTQTGLRGFSTQHLDWLLTLPGQRFEYEFHQLLNAKSAGFGIVQVPIETVYLEDNKSSHFRPLADSLRIYAPFLTFMATSGASALLDMTFLMLLMALTDQLLLSIVLARLLSAGFQYLANAHLVFPSAPKGMISLARYTALVVGLLACNYFLLQTLLSLGVGLLVAKLMTEVVLFLLSYRVQQNLVFSS